MTRYQTIHSKFVKDEINRLKKKNPDLSHKEIFQTAMSNWRYSDFIRQLKY